MRTWTVWDAVGLVERSWLWMAFVTTPVTIVVASAWSLSTDGRAPHPDDVPASAVNGLLVAVASGVVAIGGGIVAVPFTWLVGRVLTHGALRRGVHVVTHAVLAGALALGCIAVLTAWWGPLWAPMPTFPVVVGVAAGTAAAIATWRATRPGRRTDGPTHGRVDASTQARARVDAQTARRRHGTPRSGPCPTDRDGSVRAGPDE
jgi:hypothetical protein